MAKWVTCLLAALFAGLLLSGCAETANQEVSGIAENLDTDLNNIEKVTVITADGLEIPIRLDQFNSDFSIKGKNLQTADKPLQKDEVAYTVVLHRKNEAPLVVEVGKQASQFADQTYRGVGAEKLYGWIHGIVGKTLLQNEVKEIVVNADDLTRSLRLNDQETADVMRLLANSESVDQLEIPQFPLYPGYRLRLDFAETALEAKILTPTLLYFEAGSDQHYLRVDSELFSKLTEWIPLTGGSGDEFAPLYKTTELQISPGSDPEVKAAKYKMADSTFEQGLSHQLVRLLKQAKPATEIPLPDKANFSLVFVVNGEKQAVDFYTDAFVFAGKTYADQGIAAKTRALFAEIARQKQ
ncbi:hypothetical protein [Brevibacillus fulvus]|uniref:DUF4340 domain-containing protein n=1 Tax=Brevibacillus fulvus TaxID=1125967 RepID=A0A939BSF2_9BACL|nr:hypothetical protein [Brevibacillus fulvus]MBM7590642.1 hypothetical protein [Brevibacillus fulvus]